MRSILHKSTKRLYSRFCRYPVYSWPREYWELTGTNLVVIKFELCKVLQPTLKRLVFHCGNLQEIYFVSCFYIRLSNPYTPNQMFHFHRRELHELVHEKKQPSKVTKLNIVAKSCSVSEEVSK